MNVLIVTPAPPRSRLGNRITALRWQRILRGLGHRVRIAASWRGEDCDVLVALHAKKSAGSVRRFRDAHPRRAIVLALTGTDVYAPGGLDRTSRVSIARATRIVVLQREALRELDANGRRKARVVLQSVGSPRRGSQATRSTGLRARRDESFVAVAVGHLRAVKDPLLAARAARLLPASSRVRVEHYGASLDATFAARARRESERNPRWRWCGERGRRAIEAILRGADAFVQTSRAEGGSIALAEAIVHGLPILATRIPAAIGMLGRGHPGLFERGDARALASLLARCERDARFRDRLRRASARRAPLFAPAREREAWRALLGELSRAAR
jgi:putative glycosyltransferase (TIGR04348 family)